MRSTITPATHHVSEPGDERQLKQIASQFVMQYPDIHGEAYAAARTILKKHTRQQLNPDKIYWHRFSDATTSHRTFTGWEHFGAPVESMTLVELVIHRFSARDQDATPAALQQNSGFYTDGPTQDVFNEHNEVRLLPKDVLKDFWALDFSKVYKKKLLAFWTRQGESFRTLAKAHFLAAAGQARRSGKLSEDDYQTVIHAVARSLPGIMTLDMLRERVTPQPGITLRNFDIGGYVAHDIIRIVDSKGVQILYVPGLVQTFHRFADQSQLRAWVLQNCADEASRRGFTLHFFPSQVAKDQDGGKFDRYIGQLQRNEWAEQKVINRHDSIMGGDVFKHLRERAQQNMQAQAKLLASNASQRNQMWIGYLNAFIRAFGATAILSWPVALTVVGAGIANVGLNIEQAINGNTARLRKAGVLGAIFNSIFLVFNLPALRGIAQVESVADWLPVADSDELLANLQGNRLLHSAPLKATAGHMQGVHLLGNGETWIDIRGLPYRVLYNEKLATWTVVDPDNPYAFFGAKPVRLSPQGDWELLSPPKLQGGKPMDEVPGPSSAAGISSTTYTTTRSSFWDVYMRFDLEEEERLSEQALARQRAVVDETLLAYDAGPETGSGSGSESDAVAHRSGDEYVTTDDEGDDILIDSWGEEHRVFKHGDEYVGGRISKYAQNDTLFNHYLRTGEAKFPGQVQFIEELVEDLDTVNRNNDVDLFRGGSGHRSTSGIHFRAGQIKAGDILVNTDFTSFSENPYLSRVFCSSQGGVQSHLFKSDILKGAQITFDDTSVVFELPKKTYISATPVAPFSGDWEEAESVFKPGNYFQIDSIEEVVGDHFKFIKVLLHEIHSASHGPAKTASRVFDLRTGELFSRGQYMAKLGAQGASLVALFFPD
ncbi:MAG TPA: DUF6543 domain-containing protein [Pseudomonas sp.]